MFTPTAQKAENIDGFSSARSARNPFNWNFCSFMALLLLVTLSGGCIFAPINSSTNSVIANEFVPVSQLPQLLEMRIERQSKWSASLTDELNTLLILTNPRSCVVVNGRSIGKPTDVILCDNRLMMRRTLAIRIGKMLRNPYKGPAPAQPLTPQLKHPEKIKKIRATVVIDAGHGGKDPGAPNTAGHPEKILALDIAKRVARLLNEKSIKVIMTRSSDKFIELNDRAAIANRAKADLFVSIHLDSNPKSSIEGHTLYIARQPSSKAIDLAECIDKRLRKLTPGNRGLRNQDFRVLVRTNMPAVLIETGFLSNPAERVKLGNGGYRQALANSISAGIIDYLEAAQTKK